MTIWQVLIAGLSDFETTGCAACKLLNFAIRNQSNLQSVERTGLLQLREEKGDVHFSG